MTNKQSRDIDSMIFFSQIKDTPTPEDREAYAKYSADGGKIEMTPGVKAIANGKTFREVHLQMWQEDIDLGTLLKEELLEDKALESVHWLIEKTIKDNWKPWIEMYKETICSR